MTWSTTLARKNAAPPPASAAPKAADGGAAFRSDIEGLRAVAVMAVFFYHLEFKWLTGGYVGGDIFFVISGYLMTQIIARSMEQGRFKLGQFYSRRIFRIWPAMFLVLLVTLAVGAVTLMPEDLLDLSKSAWVSLLAVNNILFWQQSGYSGPDAQRNLLLHLWSLAVEQQFYLTMPFLMLAVFWRTAAPRLWLLIAVAAASLALYIYATPLARAASFYLLPTRYWEFLLGGIVALTATRVKLSPLAREALMVVGFVMIALSAAGIGRASQFPGYLALVPCVGTALVIAAGAHGPATAGRLLSLSPIAFTGRISYSLYLWHWPIVTFCRIWGISIDTLPIQLSLLALSFAVSYLSWRYIEAPSPDGGAVTAADRDRCGERRRHYRNKLHIGCGGRIAGKA